MPSLTGRTNCLCARPPTPAIVFPVVSFCVLVVVVEVNAGEWALDLVRASRLMRYGGSGYDQQSTPQLPASEQSTKVVSCSLVHARKWRKSDKDEENEQCCSGSNSAADALARVGADGCSLVNPK
jgi:hypothetical protein